MTLPWTGGIGGVVIQSNGDIVVSGITASPHYLEVTRLNTNGSLDTSFGTKGTWQTELSVAGNQSRWSFIGYLALQADGKLLVTEPYDILSPGFGW